MQEVTMYRVHNRFYNPDGTMFKAFKSINEAKRESRRYQKTGGVLRIAEKPPKVGT